MGVVISKPAINLREQLTALKAQQGYEERQFYFDNLVTNGTFDTDISGWTDISEGTGSVTWNASGYIDLTTGADTTNEGRAEQIITTVVGQTYVVQITRASGQSMVNIGTSTGGQQLATTTTYASAAFETLTFTATTTTTYIGVRNFADFSATSSIDNISVYTSDGTDVAFTMPKGWKPLHVYEDGALQREGSAYDYEVTYDGFDYSVKPVIAPSPTTQTCVIGVRA